MPGAPWLPPLSCAALPAPLSSPSVTWGGARASRGGVSYYVDTPRLVPHPVLIGAKTAPRTQRVPAPSLPLSLSPSLPLSLSSGCQGKVRAVLSSDGALLCLPARPPARTHAHTPACLRLVIERGTRRVRLVRGEGRGVSTWYGSSARGDGNVKSLTAEMCAAFSCAARARAARASRRLASK